MVMELETPSPQCVGHEFVRQYYTVLNKAPMYLHRFYSHNSLFMHGGPNSVSDPIVGQTDIHKKILSLNFVDCHAKIRMVDSHATLGSGVVIQVIGELSNCGNPMRRFMQTFVLAPQSAKKFYVHNDIFRYQDEVFNDDDSTDEGTPCEPDEDIDTPTSASDHSAFNQHNTSSQLNGSAHLHMDDAVVPQHIPTQPTPTAQAHISAPQVTPSPPAIVPVVSAPPPVEPRPSTPPMPEADGWSTNAQNTSDTSDNWASQTNESTDIIDQDTHSISTPTKDEPTRTNSSKAMNHSSHSTAPTSPSPPRPHHPPTPQHTQSSPVSSHTPTKPSIPVISQPQLPPEPKTYANLFKRDTYHSSPLPQPNIPPPHQTSSFGKSPNLPPTHNTQGLSTPTIPQENNTSSSTIPSPSQQSRPESVRSSSGSSTSGLPNTGPMPTSSFQSGGSGFRSIAPRGGMGFSLDDDKRRSMPDNQQVFVGNLPLNVGEEELRSEFSKFGAVSDVRINVSKGKTGMKGPGHHVPNFGFITFEDETAVKNCLQSKPILLHGEHRLNVEEKKARSRTDGPMPMGRGDGRPSSGRGGGLGLGPPRGGSMGGMMSGGRGGRGGGFSRDGGRGLSSGPRGGGGYMGPRR